MRGATTVERWRPGDGWTAVELPDALPDLAVLLAVGDTLWSTGGLRISEDSSDLAREVWSFDPSQGRWIRAADLQVPRYMHAALTLGSGEILVVGGLTSQPAPGGDPGVLCATPSVERRAADGTWASVAPLPRPLAEPAATLLADGRVLVCGGYDDDDVVAYAALYAPDDDRWTELPAMDEPRAGHRALLLPDRRVVVIGGARSFERGDLAGGDALFDPRRSSWARVSGPTRPRLGHTATLLPDGRVLVAGGAESDDPLAEAELWSPIDPGG